MQQHLERRTDIIYEEVAGECIVYDSNRQKAHHLNSTMTWIWNSCDGQTTLESMTERFERQFGTARTAEIVISGLQQLEHCELLQSPLQFSSTPSTLLQPSVTRRSVMAGAVLMPAVVSILAPTPAAAMSKPDKDKDKDKKIKK
jgi:hypothetical protein